MPRNAIVAPLFGLGCACLLASSPHASQLRSFPAAAPYFAGEVVVAPDTLGRGDTLTLTLRITNQSRATRVLNGSTNCWLDAEFFDATGTHVATYPPTCLMDYVSRSLLPRQTLERVVPWIADVPPGEYSVRAVWRDGRGRTRSGSPVKRFTVR